MDNAKLAFVAWFVFSMGSMLAATATTKGIPNQPQLQTCADIYAAHEAENKLIERYGGYELDLEEYIDLIHGDRACIPADKQVPSLIGRK
jgi:hypothetical protein